jgi:hypothetical protein
MMEKEEETDNKAAPGLPGRGLVISRDESEERRLREKSASMPAKEDRTGVVEMKQEDETG